MTNFSPPGPPLGPEHPPPDPSLSSIPPFAAVACRGVDAQTVWKVTDEELSNSQSPELLNTVAARAGCTGCEVVRANNPQLCEALQEARDRRYERAHEAKIYMFRNSPVWLRMVRAHIMNTLRGGIRPEFPTPDPLCGIANTPAGGFRWNELPTQLSGLRLDDPPPQTDLIDLGNGRRYRITDTGGRGYNGKLPDTKREGALLHKFMGVLRGSDENRQPLVATRRPLGRTSPFSVTARFDNGGVVSIGSEEARLHAAHYASPDGQPYNVVLLGSHREHGSFREREKQRREFLTDIGLEKVLE